MGWCVLTPFGEALLYFAVHVEIHKYVARVMRVNQFSTLYTAGFKGQISVSALIKVCIGSTDKKQTFWYTAHTFNT